MLRAATIASDVSRQLDPRQAVRSASLIASVVVALSLRVYWALLVPFNDAPDEFCHYPMVAYLAEHCRPPTMSDVPHSIPVSYPAMSPLGYAPLAAAVAVMGADHPWSYLAARFVNAMLGTAFVALTFLAVRILVPAWDPPAYIAAWIAALHPQLVFVSCYVNNDAAMLVAAAVVWLIWLRIARSPAPTDLRIWIALGAASGAAILCKPNVVGVVLAGAPIAALHVWRAKAAQGVWAGVRGPAAAVAASLVTCLPWFAWSLYHHGSIFGLEIHRDWWAAHTKSAGVRQGYLTTEQFGNFLTGSWESFWGCFGYVTTRLAPTDYLLVSLASGVALGAVAARTDDQRLSRGWKSTHAMRSAWASLVVGFLLVWVSHIYHSAEFGMSAQGRYVLPAAFPVIAIIATGAALLSKPRFLFGGPILIVVVFSWLQWSALESEKLSNRLAQPDRRVRARICSVKMDRPGSQKYQGVPLSLVGEGVIAEQMDGRTIFTRGGSVVSLGSPVDCGSIGGVAIEQRWLNGPQGDGQLRIVSTDGTREILARIPYRDGLCGLGSYRFDLRKISRLYGDRAVQIEVVVSFQESTVEWHRATLLGHDFGEIAVRSGTTASDHDPAKVAADPGDPPTR